MNDWIVREMTIEDYDKVLFVAHREEILIQAMQSFCNVRQTKDCGYFNGSQKDTKQSVIFASVATPDTS